MDSQPSTSRMDFQPSTSGINSQPSTVCMDWQSSPSPSSQIQESNRKNLGLTSSMFPFPLSILSVQPLFEETTGPATPEEATPNPENPPFDKQSIIQKLNVHKQSIIEKLREVLSIKILEENTEHFTGSVPERDSRVLLSEVYDEYPGSLSNRKIPKATPEENKFFEFSKAVLLGNESSSTSEDFLKLHPDIRLTAKIFIHFICEENKYCTDIKVLLKFVGVIAALLSNPKLILNENQLKLVVKFLLHCLFVDIEHTKHAEFRKIIAQILTVFTNGTSFTSKKLYIDIVENFKTKIIYFPLELYHWNAIFLTVKFMGTSAIRSIIIPNFSEIRQLLDKSSKSLETFNCIPTLITTEVMNSESQENEIKRFNSALKTYMDAADLRALLLELCVVFIQDVIKEDIRTEKRVIYIPKEIDALLQKELFIKEPEAMVYKFDHENCKPFFDNCFEYFGDALNSRISPVLIDYEISNYMKAQFFRRRYKLYPVNNIYLTREKYCKFEEKLKRKKLDELRKQHISNKMSQIVLQKIDFSYKTFVTMDPPNPRLGSIFTPLGLAEVKKIDLSDISRQKDETENYLASIRSVPEPWLRVLSKRYELMYEVEPQHWKFTGNLETFL